MKPCFLVAALKFHKQRASQQNLELQGLRSCSGVGPRVVSPAPGSAACKGDTSTSRLELHSQRQKRQRESESDAEGWRWVKARGDREEEKRGSRGERV